MTMNQKRIFLVGIAIMAIALFIYYKSVIHVIKGDKHMLHATKVDTIDQPKTSQNTNNEIKPHTKLRIVSKTRNKVNVITQPSNSSKSTYVSNATAKLSSRNQKYLIYLCDEGRNCEGWGDRQRAMVTVFVMSIVLKRTFGVIMTAPSELKLFYKPGEINWIIDPDELINKTKTTLEMFAETPHSKDKFLKGADNFDVVYVKSNIHEFQEIVWRYPEAMPGYLNVKGINRNTIFRNVWLRMMVPTQRIAIQLENITQSKFVANYRIGTDNSTKTELACAHVRIGRSQYLPNDHVNLNIRSVYNIWKFLDKYKTSRIFIATDHPDVRQSAQTRYGRRYIGSYAPFLNPDNMRKHKLAKVGFEQTLVDQAVLFNCDVLVTCHSGFSLYAGYLKHSLENTFYFDGQSIQDLHYS